MRFLDRRCIRDLAIIDLFNSTGIRLGEIVRLNIEDMNFEQRECKVLGKVDKERIAYFDARTRLHLEEYLSTRNDSNPALFVSIRNPATRLTAGGYQLMLRKLGQECDVEQCHAHKFRRTMATKVIDKGMPIEQVQVLLGHEQIATTMFYARVKQSNVKFSHRKYIG